MSQLKMSTPLHYIRNFNRVLQKIIPTVFQGITRQIFNGGISEDVQLVDQGLVNRDFEPDDWTVAVWLEVLVDDPVGRQHTQALLERCFQNS